VGDRDSDWDRGLSQRRRQGLGHEVGHGQGPGMGLGQRLGLKLRLINGQRRVCTGPTGMYVYVNAYYMSYVATKSWNDQL